MENETDGDAQVQLKKKDAEVGDEKKQMASLNRENVADEWLCKSELKTKVKWRKGGTQMEGLKLITIFDAVAPSPERC